MVVKFSATKLLQVLCNEVNASAKISLALIDCTLIYSSAGSPGATCYETSIKNIPTHYVLVRGDMKVMTKPMFYSF